MNHKISTSHVPAPPLFHKDRADQASGDMSLDLRTVDNSGLERVEFAQLLMPDRLPAPRTARAIIRMQAMSP